MDPSIIRYNSKIIYKTNDLDKSKFTVDNKGRLKKVSKFNLLGRFINWLNKDANHEKVCFAFDQTILGIQDLCNPKLHTKKELRKNYVSDSRASSPAYHYVHVLRKIENSQKFSHLGVNQAEIVDEMRIKANLPEMEI